jgi:hypothetical protein
MKAMRCKVEITNVEGQGTGYETIHARPVARREGYPHDGSDEDNTFARFSPSGEFSLCIANPELHGVYQPGQRFYVDWTPIEPEQPAQA